MSHLASESPSDPGALPGHPLTPEEVDAARLLLLGVLRADLGPGAADRVIGHASTALAAGDEVGARRTLSRFVSPGGVEELLPLLRPRAAD